MGRLNHEMVVELQRYARVVLGDHRLMQLFAGAYSYYVMAAARADNAGQIGHAHARNLGHINLSAKHLRETPNNQLHAFIQRDQKARHPLIGDCESPGVTLRQEVRNDAAAATHYVSIPYDGKTG